MICSLALTTLTNPTGTPMISAGLYPFVSISSLSVSRAVGAFPIAKIVGPSRAAALSILTAARVIPRAEASSATSGSAMKQIASPPHFASAFLFTPASAMFVSVTILAPLRIASLAFSIAPGEKAIVSAYSKSAVVWITLITTGASSAGISFPICASSSRMICMLVFSISCGLMWSTFNGFSPISVILPLDSDRPVDQLPVQALSQHVCKHVQLPVLYLPGAFDPRKGTFTSRKCM